MCNARWRWAEQSTVIPAQRHPHRTGEPATEPLAVVLTDLIPAQRRSSPAVPNPVLVEQLAARSTAVRPLIHRVTAVIIGVVLVAAILVVLMVVR